MTSEELQQAAEALTKAWAQFGETLQEISDAINKCFGQVGIDIYTLLHSKEKKPKSPKHAYHFPPKHRHVKSRLQCIYAPTLKPQRHLPYQRRIY